MQPAQWQGHNGRGRLAASPLCLGGFQWMREAEAAILVEVLTAARWSRLLWAELQEHTLIFPSVFKGGGLRRLWWSRPQFPSSDVGLEHVQSAWRHSAKYYLPLWLVGISACLPLLYCWWTPSPPPVCGGTSRAWMKGEGRRCKNQIRCLTRTREPLTAMAFLQKSL